MSPYEASACVIDLIKLLLMYECVHAESFPCFPGGAKLVECLKTHILSAAKWFHRSFMGLLCFFLIKSQFVCNLDLLLLQLNL